MPPVPSTDPATSSPAGTAGGHQGSSRTRRRVFVGGLGLAVLLPAVMLLGKSADKHPAAHATPAAAASSAATQPDAAQRNADEIARVMEFFRVTQPDVYEQAIQFRDANPEQFEKLVRGAASTVNHLEDLRKRDPVLFNLKMQDLELAYKSFRMARELKRPDLPSADRTRLTADLSDIVAKEFDVCQQMRQHEVDFLRQRLQDVAKQVQDRAKQKDDLIKQRVQDLVDKPPRLEW